MIICIRNDKIISRDGGGSKAESCGIHPDISPTIGESVFAVELYTLCARDNKKVTLIVEQEVSGAKEDL